MDEQQAAVDPLSEEQLDALLNANREWLGEALGMSAPDNWQAILAATERARRAASEEVARLAQEVEAQRGRAEKAEKRCRLWEDQQAEADALLAERAGLPSQILFGEAVRRVIERAERAESRLSVYEEALKRIAGAPDGYMDDGDRSAAGGFMLYTLRESGVQDIARAALTDEAQT